MNGMFAVKAIATFNPGAVLDPYYKARRRWLFQNAAKIRTIARRGMKRRKAVSEVGQPPSAHDGGLRAGILFAVGNESAVIGPELRNSKAAAALEHGGMSTRRDRRGRRVRFRVRPRPFMSPALQAAAPTLPSGWRGVIR